MLQETDTPKTFYIFSKESFSYILGNGNPEKIPCTSGNGTPEKISYISGSNFPGTKSKNNPLLKFSYISRKQKFLAKISKKS